MNSKLILSTILFLLFIGSLNSQSIYSSISQTGRNVEIKLAQPLYLFNITSLDYLYNNYDFNGTSVLNSCIFNSTFFSLDLSNLKNIDHHFGNSYVHYFSICSGLSYYSYAQSVISNNYYHYTTGELKTETFKFGRFGVDNFALKLTYSNNDIPICQYSERNYYFQCDENQEFNFTAPSQYSDCYADVTIKTKYVCPYKNTKRTPIKYSLIQPNILRFTLDENFSNLISINNGYTFQSIPIKPIIDSCDNDGDIVTVNGIFSIDFLSNYTFYFEGGYRIDPSMIISFNSTTLVINTKGYADNNFFISLFGEKSESCAILKPQQQMVNTPWYDSYYKQLIFGCTNCIGAILIGLPKNYTKYGDEGIYLDALTMTLNGGGIYFEAPIYPYKRSDVTPLPTDIQKISDNEIFQFNGSSIVSISGLFIPKVYDNKAYIIGKLEFLNGTICILNYYTLNNTSLTEGKFNIPSGVGNGNFSIYTNDKLVHSNSFTYQPPLNWVSSITQNLEKVQLHLSFPFSLFEITSIKYNDKNGKDLEYTLIEPNIISFTLNSYSSNVLSFNDDYHIETLSNGLNYRPIIYSYSIENGIITMEGLFVSKLTNFKFYAGGNAIGSDQVTYFDSSRLSLIFDQVSHLYVYSDEYSFTMVPDLTITSVGDNLLFTCSLCLGGYLNIKESSQSNQGYQFSENGTIVKQFNTKTILNNYSVFTFTKYSKTLIIQPPLPTNIIVDGSFPQFSTFSNNTIIVSGDFLMDKYYGFDYLNFQFQFDNGTIHSGNKQLLSKSVQNYKYQINAPSTYGSGNFSVFIIFENGKKLITKSFPFNYPTKPIFNSISRIKDKSLIISGDGFFEDVKIVGSFKITTQNKDSNLFSDPDVCGYSPYERTSQKIYCDFGFFNNFVYSHDDPVTIQIRNPQYSKFPFEPFYTQTFFYDSNVDSEMLNNDISLHSVFSKLVATLFILISILLQ
ncbi:hypothetical protein ACTFIV_008277 [Dictyostelium citrinum]